MSFRQKLYALFVSLFIVFAYFDSSYANNLAKEEKAYIYMINLGQKSSLISSSLANYIHIKESIRNNNIRNNTNNLDKDQRIQKDIRNAYSMLTTARNYTSEISKVSDYIRNWENGKTLYGKDLVVKGDELKPITEIIIDVSNKKFTYKTKNKIIEANNLSMFYSHNKPKITYTDTEVQNWIKQKELEKQREQERIKKEEDERIANEKKEEERIAKERQERERIELERKKQLEKERIEDKERNEAFVTYIELEQELGIEGVDITNLSKQDIDKEISLLKEKKKQIEEQKAEEERQQKMSIRTEDERRQAEGLESVEQQETRIQKEKELITDISRQVNYLAMAGVAMALSPDKYSKSDIKEFTNAGKMIEDEISQAKKICGADVLLKSDIGKNTPCMNIVENINYMILILNNDLKKK